MYTGYMHTVSNDIVDAVLVPQIDREKVGVGCGGRAGKGRKLPAIRMKVANQIFTFQS